MRAKPKRKPPETLLFPVEVADKYGRYTSIQKWGVVFRTANLLYEGGEEIAPASLATEAQPYLPKLKKGSIGSWICVLDNESRAKLHLSPKFIDEDDGTENLPVDPTFTFDDFAASRGDSVPEYTSVADPPAKNKPPFSLFGENDLAIIRQRQAAAKRAVPRPLSVDVPGVASLVSHFLRHS